jgi:hypothetical protein
VILAFVCLKMDSRPKHVAAKQITRSYVPSSMHFIDYIINYIKFICLFVENSRCDECFIATFVIIE